MQLVITTHTLTYLLLVALYPPEQGTHLKRAKPGTNLQQIVLCCQSAVTYAFALLHFCTFARACVVLCGRQGQQVCAGCCVQ